MAAHVITSSYFGDYEYDLGCSVRWHQYLFSTLFACDVAGVRARSHLLAWDATFPAAKFAYMSNSYFGSTSVPGPAAASAWRQQSFAKALSAWKYSDDDWVFFLDATEALVFDVQNGALDPYEFADPGAEPALTSWVTYLLSVLDEGQDTISFPFWAYTRASAPWSIESVIDTALEDALDAVQEGGTFNGLDPEDVRATNRSSHQMNYQYYTLAGYLPRAFKVSVLKDPGFDWSALDEFVATPDSTVPEVGASMVSYAYARYAEPGNIDSATGTSVDEAHDVGWTMRKLVSRVRPVDGLQTDDWGDPDTADEHSPAMPEDPDTGLPYEPPAWLVGTGILEEGFDPEDGTPPLEFDQRQVEEPQPWGGEYEVDTPLYRAIPFRKAPRDGLLYLSAEKAPVPWDYVRNEPAVDPTLWDEYQSQPPFQQ